MLAFILLYNEIWKLTFLKGSLSVRRNEEICPSGFWKIKVMKSPRTLVKNDTSYIWLFRFLKILLSLEFWSTCDPVRKWEHCLHLIFLCLGKDQTTKHSVYHVVFSVSGLLVNKWFKLSSFFFVSLVFHTWNILNSELSLKSNSVA
jgi:hypothetical protein